MVAAIHEMLGYAEGAVGYPIDVGREGFGDDRDPHVHQRELRGIAVGGNSRYVLKNSR
jgi:hypothetical protein